MKRFGRFGKCIISFGMILALSMVTACGSDEISPLTSVETTENVNESNETSTDSSEAATENDTKGSNDAEQVSDQEQISDEQNDNTANDITDPGAIDDEQCRAKIDELRLSEPVSPEDSELLTEMAWCVTAARILDESGAVFSKMDSDKQGALRTQMIKEILMSGNAFSDAITVKRTEGDGSADVLIPVDYLVAFLKDVYGAEDFTKGDQFESIEDGNVLWSYGDGDPWERVEHMQFFEDDNYYLLSGPSFFESNGGDMSFKGYADILFAKNPESRYGVTMLYGRYRNDKINVTSVDATSELEAANGKNYSGDNLIDDDYSTVWVEGVSGVGLGESVTMHLDKTQPVYGVVICNGYTADYDLYSKNGTLASVKVDFGNGKVVEENVGGYGSEYLEGEYLAEMNLNKIELPEPVLTDTITVTITSANVGSKYDDTCVSEIRVY